MGAAHNLAKFRDFGSCLGEIQKDNKLSALFKSQKGKKFVVDNIQHIVKVQISSSNLTEPSVCNCLWVQRL